MKRIFALCMVLVLLAVALSSCSSNSELKQLEKLVAEKNYEAKQTVLNIPMMGDLVTTVQYDGDIMYQPSTEFSDEIYMVGPDKDYKLTVYSKDGSGVWTKTEMEYGGTEEDMMSAIELVDICDADKYEKVKGEKHVYKQKEDVVFDGCEDVTITVKDDTYIIKMRVKMASSYGGGTMLDAELVLSRFGEIELTLPQVNG